MDRRPSNAAAALRALGLGVVSGMIEMTRTMIRPKRLLSDQDETPHTGDGIPVDSQQAWRLANEARDRGEWARVAKLVRLARSAVAGN